MERNRILIAILMVLLLHSETMVSLANSMIYRFLSEVIQYNIAGLPITHKKTEWDFDPEVGKQRRIRYEQENGHFGEYAIKKLGMGIGYKGPWGTPVKS